MVSQHSRQLLNLYGHYKAGHLYCAGGIGDQPNYYLEAMSVIDRLASESD